MITLISRFCGISIDILHSDLTCVKQRKRIGTTRCSFGSGLRFFLSQQPTQSIDHVGRVSRDSGRAGSACAT